MKSEYEAITKLLKPLLKETYFVKTSVRVDRLHSKLKTEGCLSSEEISIKHPFHPDIDVLYWHKDYQGEPNIYAAEVKYFRLREGTVYPNIYEGLGEALMLLSFGVDFVSLWHLFDPEIPSETGSRYRDLTQSLVSEAYTSPVNYQSWLLPEITLLKSEQKPNDFRSLTNISNSLKRSNFNFSLMQTLKTNPLRNRWDARIIRAIIKKAYRIVTK